MAKVSQTTSRTGSIATRRAISKCNRIRRLSSVAKGSDCERSEGEGPEPGGGAEIQVRS